MDESLRRGIIRAILALGGLFLGTLVFLSLLPPPLPESERLALISRASELDGRHDPVAAAAAYREAIKLDPSVENHKGLIRALLRAEKAAEAIAILDDPPAEPVDSEWEWLRSRAALQAGDTARAQEALAKAGDYRSNHPIEPEPSPRVGSERCADCHEANHRDQIASAHARTFSRVENLRDLTLPDAPIVDFFDPEATHSLRREDQAIVLETRIGADLYRAVAEYAFGSGDRGLTLTGTDAFDNARELRLSKYAPPHGWQVTSGQTIKPLAREDYVGRPLASEDLRACFGCHTTVAEEAMANAGPTARDHAIGCEQCHGPGANHLKAVEAKLPDLMIARAHPGPGGGVQELCARCHKPKISNAYVDPVNRILNQISQDEVRFQSVTLPKSRCVTESQGALNCLTCHAPHKNAETDPAFYEAKCLQCHEAGRPSTRSTCKVNPSTGCLGCHMPAVDTAVPFSTFTDHHIRIHRHSQPPPLLRRPD